MKRLIVCFALALLLVISAAAFSEPSVVDDAGLLTESQYDKVSEKLDKLRKKYNFDIAIYTEEEMSGFDAESTADDIFDYGDYGVGDDRDGMLFYICADEREYHFSTSGYGIYAFTKNGLIKLEKDVVGYLEDDNYFDAFIVFADVCDELLAMAKDGSPYNEKQKSTASVVVVIALAVIIPFVVAKSKTEKQKRKMKTAVKQSRADHYMKSDSLKLDVSRDVFLYSNIVRTPRAKEESSTHKSSSGRTHGGRGGKF